MAPTTPLRAGPGALPVPTCRIDGCERTTYNGGDGMCKMHWQRQLKHGDPGPPEPLHGPPRTGCNVDGCDRPHLGHGYCRSHLARLRKYGDPGGPLRVIRRTCQVPGCDRRHRSRGYCEPHYYRWRKYGDPLHTTAKRRCTVPGRGREHLGRGYCVTHYYRWRSGKPLDGPRRARNPRT